MDGTNRSVIIEDKITWPNGLTLDFINDRIYWADAREDYIEFASLDGKNRHTGNRPVNTFTFLNCLTGGAISSKVLRFQLFVFDCCICLKKHRL